MGKPTVKAPGLKLRPRATGWAAYWVPSPTAVELGYPSGSAPLSHLLDMPELLVDTCIRLQNDMLAWMDGLRRSRNSYDGTLGSVFRVYQTHEDSPFHTLSPGGRKPYIVYLRRLESEIGLHRVDQVTGLDIKRWHRGWSSDGKHKAAGNMCVAVIKAALTFCIVAGHRGCRPLRDDIRELRLPANRPRMHAASGAEVAHAIATALALNQRSAALCYAFQFETALRQWDVAGQWYPLNAPVICAIASGARKWAGLEWRHIGTDMVLRYTPTKTQHSSGVEVTIDLKVCPMVLDLIEQIPPEERTGPIVINESTGLPYTQHQFEARWKKVKATAGLPDWLWSRDLRASAITEARGGGATNDDGAKVAGHTKSTTTAEVYDRESLEAHRRFAKARLSKRNMAS